jgi:hypothetical protein
MKRHSVLLVSFVALGCSGSSSPMTMTPTDAGQHASPDSGHSAADAGQHPSPDAGADSGSLTPAEQAFWTAFHAGDLTAGGTAWGELQTNYEANSKDPYNTLLLALCSVWEASEAGRNPSTQGQMEAKYGPFIGLYMSAAYKLDPSNGFAEGFLGYGLYDQGQQEGDAGAGAVAMGEGLIDQVVSTDPTFGFFKVLESQTVPVGDPLMQAGEAAAWTVLETCGGEAVDPTTPNLEAYAAAENSGKGTPHCFNDDIAPHGMEGFLLNMGDLLAKEGKSDVATQIYKGATLSSTYAQWPYASAIAGRLGGTPYTGGPYGVPNVACGVCHAAK